MNKQEAIEKILNLDLYGLSPAESKKEIIPIVRQLDESEKPVIPKFVAEWLKEYRYANTLLKVLNAAEDERIVPSVVNNWILDNKRDFVVAWYDGYEIEQEKLYIIPLKGLITTDGHQQYLSSKIGRYFASRRIHHLKQTFTQTELDNNVPACYREWAKPVEVE